MHSLIYCFTHYSVDSPTTSLILQLISWLTITEKIDKCDLQHNNCFSQIFLLYKKYTHVYIYIYQYIYPGNTVLAYFSLKFNEIEFTTWIIETVLTVECVLDSSEYMTVLPEFRCPAIWFAIVIIYRVNRQVDWINHIIYVIFIRVKSLSLCL